jgi:hypothetical protein
MGVAVTALVFSGVGGASATTDAGPAADGFVASLLMLAGVAVGAALVAASRGQVPLSSAAEARVE